MSESDLMRNGRGFGLAATDSHHAFRRLKGRRLREGERASQPASQRPNMSVSLMNMTRAVRSSLPHERECSKGCCSTTIRKFNKEGGTAAMRRTTKTRSSIHVLPHSAPPIHLFLCSLVPTPLARCSRWGRGMAASRPPSVR